MRDGMTSGAPGTPIAVASGRRGGAGAASSRDRLLQAIQSRFQASGFNGTRIADVADDVGFTTGAFYRHFVSKAAAFHLLFDSFATDLTSELVVSTDLADYCERWLACHEAHFGVVRATEEVAQDDAVFLGHLQSYRQLWAGSAMRHLPQGLDTRTLQIVANLTVDILEYQSFTVIHGWGAWQTSAEVSRNLSALMTAGLYRRSAKGVPAPAQGSRGLGPSTQPNPLGLMTWQPAEGRASPTSRPGRLHRAAILKAATQVFGELGLSRSSIGVIAARAGVSPATVYRYFGDKNDIFRCLLSAVRDELYANALIRLDRNGRMMIEPVALQYLEVRREYAAVYRVWRELLAPGSEMEEAWVWIRSDFQHRIARVVSFGQRGGLIAKGFDADVVAQLLVAAFDGPSHARFDLGWEDDVRDQDFARVLASIFGKGLGAGRKRDRAVS